jgi:hypothetical protein
MQHGFYPRAYVGDLWEIMNLSRRVTCVTSHCSFNHDDDDDERTLVLGRPQYANLIFLTDIYGWRPNGGRYPQRCCSQQHCFAPGEHKQRCGASSRLTSCSPAKVPTERASTTKRTS